MADVFDHYYQNLRPHRKVRKDGYMPTPPREPEKPRLPPATKVNPANGKPLCPLCGSTDSKPMPDIFLARSCQNCGTKYTVADEHLMAVPTPPTPAPDLLALLRAIELPRDPNWDMLRQIFADTLYYFSTPLELPDAPGNWWYVSGNVSYFVVVSGGGGTPLKGSVYHPVAGGTHPVTDFTKALWYRMVFRPAGPAAITAEEEQRQLKAQEEAAKARTTVTEATMGEFYDKEIAETPIEVLRRLGHAEPAFDENLVDELLERAAAQMAAPPATDLGDEVGFELGRDLQLEALQDEIIRAELAMDELQALEVPGFNEMQELLADVREATLPPEPATPQVETAEQAKARQAARYEELKTKFRRVPPYVARDWV